MKKGKKYLCPICTGKGKATQAQIQEFIDNNQGSDIKQENAKVKLSKKCVWCRISLANDTKEREDPFRKEVYGESILDFWCDDCYRERKEEI